MKVIRKKIALILVLAMSLSMLYGAGVVAQASQGYVFTGSGYSIRFTVLSEWSTGYNAEIVITNTGSDALDHVVLSVNRNLGLGESGVSGGRMVWQNSSETTIQLFDWQSYIPVGGTATLNLNSSSTNGAPRPTDFRLREAARQLVPTSDYELNTTMHSTWEETQFNNAIILNNITNRVMQGWSVEFDISSSAVINVAHNADLAQEGNQVTLCQPHRSAQSWHPGQTLYLSMMGTKPANSTVEVSNVRVFERVALPYGGWPPVVDPDSIRMGIEFEQISVNLPGLIAPSLNHVRIEALNFIRGIYELTFASEYITIDSRGVPFFFWNSPHGIFDNYTRNTDGSISVVFRASADTFDQSVYVVVGLGDNLGQVDRRLLVLKGNDEHAPELEEDFSIDYIEEMYVAQLYAEGTSATEVIAIVPTANGSPGAGTDFPDVPRGHWAYNAVSEMTRRGIFTGYGDGTFRPNNLVTFAEFLAIIFRSVRINESPPIPSRPQWAGHWAERYLNYAAHRLILPADVVTGNEHITRQAAFYAMYTVFGSGRAREWNRVRDTVYRHTNNLSFSDSGEIGVRYRDAVTSLYRLGIAGGFPGGTFEPRRTLTREQAARIVFTGLQPHRDLPAPIIERMLGDSTENMPVIGLGAVERGYVSRMGGGAFIFETDEFPTTRRFAVTGFFGNNAMESIVVYRRTDSGIVRVPIDSYGRFVLPGSAVAVIAFEGELRSNFMIAVDRVFIRPFIFSHYFDHGYLEGLSLTEATARTRIEGFQAVSDRIFSELFRLNTSINRIVLFESSIDQCLERRRTRYGDDNFDVNSLCLPFGQTEACFLHGAPHFHTPNCWVGGVLICGRVEHCSSSCNDAEAFARGILNVPVPGVSNPGHGSLGNIVTVWSGNYTVFGNFSNRSFAWGLRTLPHSNIFMFERGDVNNIRGVYVHEVAHMFNAPDHYHEWLDENKTICRSEEICSNPLCNPTKEGRAPRPRSCIMYDPRPDDVANKRAHDAFCVGCIGDMRTFLSGV
ncbi:MAG: S-layer homology domain-containing protein [Oscillospiraceae bacterium]|nr:S-layer homology domain-containing protein [Oscillospiraceae bacterium]